MGVAVLPVVERLAEFLAESLDADEVILFGSRARGDAHSGSDIDILAITSKAVDRTTVNCIVREFRRAHPGTPFVDVHAHTAAGLRDIVRAGSVTMREALREGRVLAGSGQIPGRAESGHRSIVREWSRVGAVEQWLAKASDDARGAATHVDNDQWWMAAFHAQQAAEKALKALIVHLGSEPERTHELAALVDRVRELDRSLGGRIASRHGNALQYMTPYGVESRYPDSMFRSTTHARLSTRPSRCSRWLGRR